MPSLEQIQLERGSVVSTFDVATAHATSIGTLANTFRADSAEPLSAIELHATFIQYCVENGSSEAALAVFDAFCLTYGTATTDIHVVVQAHGLDEDAARRVLKGYYSAWPILGRHSGSLPAAPAPALFAAKSASLMAMFGGQLGADNYLDEATWLLDVYRPLLLGFVSRMSAFLHRESQDKRISRMYPQGFDVLRWLTTPGAAPSESYLLSSPICMPLYGLIQLMHVVVLCKTLGISPGDLARRFKVAVGHSLGIGIAAAFSTLSDEQSLYDIGKRILGIQLLVGAFPQLHYPIHRLAISATNDASQDMSGEPRPMLSVQGVTKPALEQLIAKFNSRLASPDEHAYLAVTNSYDRFLVASQAKSAVELAEFLRSVSAGADEDQSRIPYPKRKPVIVAQYTTISVPYHSVLLEGAADEAHAMAVEKGWVLRSGDMQIAVRAGDDGHDIRSEADLTRYLIDSICVLPVNWPQATQYPGTTHIVDFGPGGLSGFGFVAYKSIEGSGVSIVCTGVLVPHSSKSYLGSKADLYKANLADVTAVPNWGAECGPKLVRAAHNGELQIDTPMSRVLGAPTVMVGAMMPTTVNEHFIVAVNNAGYHTELAGGGIITEPDLERRISNLVKLSQPGQGITLNCIYIDQRQWSFQFPALLRMRAKGVPIAGLCIGGGVPSLDSATAIINSLRSAGIRHVAFKPNAASAIRDVVNIARAHTDFPIVLQWTGGRAGGHHSFEDFHQPILETYAAVRTCPNIALVAGSGFGDADGSLPYITGDWSAEFGRAPMPFDGILLGTRVMAAKEAGTAQAAKELIVAAPGLSDSEWHKSLDSTEGGVTTIVSEYGERNHSLVTRATVLVKEMRNTILNQPREKIAALLLARKDEIIARLNSDYLRPWFGRKADGRVVDLEEMTYAEVINRLVELTYVKHQQRWVHESYRRLVFEFVARAERRLGTDLPELSIVPDLQDAPPLELAQSFTERYSDATIQLLHSEDVQFFVAICKRSGQKPVPFIAVLDADFGRMLMKDSFWQSEDLDVVPDQDPQRIAIQQGVVSTRFSTTVNEPVKDILDGVYRSHIAALLSRDYNGDVASVPVATHAGAQLQTTALPADVVVSVTDALRSYQLPDSQEKLPTLDLWLETLAGPTISWLHALLTTPVIVEGSSYIDSYIRRALRPRPGQRVAVKFDGCQPQSLAITDGHGNVDLTIVRLGGVIELNIFQPTPTGLATLQYQFVYRPAQQLTPIHLVVEGHGDRTRQLYRETWIDNSDAPTEYEDHADPDALLLGNGFEITEDHVYAMCQVVGNRSQHYLRATDAGLRVPMEFLYYSATPAIMRILASTVFGDGQLGIVHLYNRIELVDSTAPLMVGDVVSSRLRIDGITNTASGKRFKVLGQLSHSGQVIAHIETAFISRDIPVCIEDTFERTNGQLFTIQLATANDVTALLAKEWFLPSDDASAHLVPGSQVEFCLGSAYHFKSEDVYSRVVTTGRASVLMPIGRPAHVASVHFECGVSAKDPVIEYLRRHEVPSTTPLSDGDGYSLVSPSNQDLLQVTVPDSNWEYAKVSADGNAIHTNPYIADVAGLPGTITHGLWTSASTRALVECYAANDEPERIRMYRTNFVGMVLPRDQLRTELLHVGMKGGRMLVKGTTSKVGGGPVLECTAEIDQPATAYVFTGQGSQEVGMGMELFKQSVAARGVWNRADRHMVAKYGVSLLDIVRNNPKEHTVHFGSKTGEELQRSYMSLTKSSRGDKSGAVPLFPEITLDSSSYTHRSPTGLLNSTQFTQVILITFAMAAVADMRANSLVQKDAVFAGHSLGEYAALASIGGMFTLEDALDICFYRGLLMQSAVERDGQGRSQYGMVAVDPSRLGRGADDGLLATAIDVVCEHSNGLLEVVNYNVRSSQYVVAGTLHQLAVLRLVLDALVGQGASTDGNLGSRISLIVGDVLATPIDSKPVRGRATIPLPGIDVPFHSSQLLSGVDEFRAVLLDKIRPENVDYSALHFRYVPNLTAVPFEVSREYFGMVHNITQSPVVASVLGSWTDDAMDSDDSVARLAATLLVELLAYQFASPVQWIDTQDVLLNRLGVRRLVEVGASPVLSGMSAKTLKHQPRSSKHVDVLHVERDRDALYFIQQDVEVTEPMISQPAQPEQQVQQAQPATVAVVEPVVPVAQSPASAAPLVDVPLQALDVVHTIVAHTTKRSLADVPPQKSIKTLMGGKSTLQNEIVGDLHKEFGSKVPDKAEDLSLHDLAAAIGTFGGNLGKHTQSHLARLFSNKMPGGISLSSSRSTLQSVYGLGPHRQDALLLVALTMEPASRLSGDAEAKAWLDSVAQAYATKAGISYAAATTSAGSSGSQAGAPAISSAEMEKMQQKQHEHIRQQIQVLARYAGIDPREGARLAEDEKTRAAEMQAKLDGISAEFGDELIDGVQPRFDANKARHFESSWNWARQEAYELTQKAIVSCTAGSATKSASVDEAALQRLRNRSSPGLLQMLAGSLSILKAANDKALDPAIQVVSQLHDACSQSLAQSPVYRELSAPTGPQVDIGPDGTVLYAEVPRSDEPSFAAFVEHMRQPTAPGMPPHIHLKKRYESGSMSHSAELSSMYYEGLSEICGSGLSFAGKTALVTGCGRGSIGADIVSRLLSGGARVIVTTSSYGYKTSLFFGDMYRTHGAGGSELIVVPFNQASTSDIKQLVDFIYSKPGSAKGLGWDLDYVIPFAAVSDIGSFATNLSSRSELAQRVQLTNVLRLLGAIKDTKEQLGFNTRASLVVLPLSPNHGDFGGDGLYSECKLGLESAFNRWESESWQDYLSIAGAIIGWTRGTSLMAANDWCAGEFESRGVRTFTASEMAFMILGLLRQPVRRHALHEPIWADLSSGMTRFKHLSTVNSNARQAIMQKSSAMQHVAREAARDYAAMILRSHSKPNTTVDEGPLAKHKHHFPAPRQYEQLEHLRHLQGMMNLDKVIVITGYGEVSPHGTAETRWEMEAYGEFSLEGCIELAWIMGLIKHFNGTLKATGAVYVGWVDAKTEEPIRDIDVKSRYEEFILAHTGIRLIEPELTGGYDPNKRSIMREIQIEHDMEPFEASAEEAQAFKSTNGSKVDIWESSNGGSWLVRFLKGALIRVPMALRGNRLVAGLVPTGWDPRRFGIPDDIAEQVDPVTCYVLVATVEALVRSGITDPYELYKYFHVSEVGSSIGSTIGGGHSLQQVFSNRRLDMNVRNDVVQETFISTVQAWVNMLLMSSSGPVKPVVGACATAALSIDVAIETIQSGKARVMIAGGVEDLFHESSFEFGNMGATSNSVEEFARGRTPLEMSRPCTSTRCGFVEGQGAGIVTLMSATAAIEFGAPIYGVVAMSGTATDKQGRSVPAPGKGVLTSARETNLGATPRLLDFNYRRWQMELHMAAVDELRAEELDALASAADPLDSKSHASLVDQVELQYKRQRSSLQDMWSNEFWKNNPAISPLRGCLAVWGLTADDIGLASFHGTSTMANDKNESEVLNTQLGKIGRTLGHVVPAVCQKWLTGHSKGAAACYMLNGVIQSLRTGLIPGNRNADNVDQDLQRFEYVVYPSKSVQTPGIKAGLLKSFGFGQVGGELLILHSDYLLATLTPEQLAEYNVKMQKRSATSERYWQDTLVGNHPFIQVKSQPPFTAEQEKSVFLDPLARAKYDSATGEYKF
ncbi:fatty acid synthase alpha subunit Lsd1 [Coemansia spiralis]|uniref:Fatty acid synthase alpha subunit Lsd1 n=1 Tax=Coemansia spiralis TaxID=417178 RepID=A0A9W8L5P4_9FUNG|nr:fatty acid synthase alpha subunit Lsd1 [Coemansia spiralis]